MVFLLDANVLIALIDAGHILHESAHRWFGTQGQAGWASCPLTENAVLRIMGHPRYPGSSGSPLAVLPSLASLRALPGHRFWPDDISLMDAAHVDASRLLSASQVTDTYLLALARAHGGKLATFDRRLVTTAIRDGDASLHLIA